MSKNKTHKSKKFTAYLYSVNISSTNISSNPSLYSLLKKKLPKNLSDRVLNNIGITSYEDEENEKWFGGKMCKLSPINSTITNDKLNELEIVTENDITTENGDILTIKDKLFFVVTSDNLIAITNDKFVLELERYLNGVLNKYLHLIPSYNKTSLSLSNIKKIEIIEPTNKTENFINKSSQDFFNKLWENVSNLFITKIEDLEDYPQKIYNSFINTKIVFSINKNNDIDQILRKMMLINIEYLRLYDNKGKKINLNNIIVQDEFTIPPTNLLDNKQNSNNQDLLDQKIYKNLYNFINQHKNNN
jgi:hypothetical protein